MSYVQYKKNLKQARRQVHIDAKNYQDKIEDDYLAAHQQEIKRKHFEFECTFRKQIFVNAFRVHENLKQWGVKDDRFSSRQTKHLHDEDVRKINRNRILKIMEHESNNFWFTDKNVDSRLKEETIFLNILLLPNITTDYSLKPWHMRWEILKNCIWCLVMRKLYVKRINFLFLFMWSSKTR